MFHLKFQYLFLSFNYINPLTSHLRNSFHELFITFIPRDWNLLTDSLISAFECAVDSVTKFTSLVRARD